MSFLSAMAGSKFMWQWINFHIPQLSQSFSMNDEAVKPPNVAVYLKGVQGFFFWSFKQMWVQYCKQYYHQQLPILIMIFQKQWQSMFNNNNKNNKQIEIPDSPAQQIGRYKINNFTISIKDFGRKCELLLHGERKKSKTWKQLNMGKRSGYQTNASNWCNSNIIFMYR